MAGQKNYFGKGNIRPQLPGAKKSVSPADPLAKAKDNLKDLEDSASKNAVNFTASSPKSAKELEQPKTTGFYTGSGRSEKRSDEAKQKRAKLLRRSSPVIAILLALFLGFATIIGAPSLLGPHIEALFTEATDTQYVGNNLMWIAETKRVLSGKTVMTPYMKSRFEKQGFTVAEGTLTFRDTTINADNFDNIYNSDAEFRQAYSDAKRGRVSGFFDDAANNIYKKLGLSRDVFDNYRNTGDSDVDEASYNKLMTDYFDGDSNTRINTVEDKPILDEEGNDTGATERVTTGEDVTISGAAGEESMLKARSYLDSVGSKVAAANAGCAALQVGNMIAVAVASNEMYQSINAFMTKTENISKAKYGDSDAAAVNPVLNFFTKTVTTTYTDAETGEEITVTGSPLEGEGERVILGQVKANKNNSKNYSLYRLFGATTISLASAGLQTEVCSTARAAGAVISLATLAVPGGGFIRAAVGMLLNVPLAIGVQVAAGAVLGIMVPTIAKVLFTNHHTISVGIPGGEDYARGAAAANMRIGISSSGQTGATEEKILAYNQLNEQMIAQDAEIDRLNRSPFDLTSKNTFLGSIVRQAIIPLATTNSGISALTTLASSVKNTLVSAAGADSSYITSFGNCDNELGQLYGAKGDLYCSMIPTTDTTIFDIDLAGAEYQDFLAKNIEIDETGKETIKDNSPLAHFIEFHMLRYSPVLVKDANIANACELSLGIVGDNLPVLGDFVDIVNAGRSEYCNAVATGEYYINSPDNPHWDEEVKYTQLYVLRNRVLNQMKYYGDEKDPVLAFEEKYESEHPLDNSRAGYLARISGLTKEDAETVLIIADYYQRLDEYNPATAYQFEANNEAESSTKQNLLNLTIARLDHNGNLWEANRATTCVSGHADNNKFRKFALAGVTA